MLSPYVQAPAACDEELARGCLDEYRRDQQGRGEEMLKGVEHNQRLTSCQPSLDQKRDSLSDLDHAEGFGDRRRHELRIMDLSEGDKEDTVRKWRLLHGGDFNCQAGFSDAPRPCQGKQTNPWVLQRGGHFRDLVCTAERGCGRDWECTGRGL